ncbi:hypothetical protein K3495_g9909 [Podosphaera aphanis]|nr:hypothetical protein K3495_g9909 [Podosphaera aphanis]
MIRRGYNPLEAGITATTPIPVASGPSTPFTDRNLPRTKEINDNGGDITPPERPQSTPFLVQDMHDRNRKYTFDFDYDGETRSSPLLITSQPTIQATKRALLCCLPDEIHDFILDYLVGTRGSAAFNPISTGNARFIRGWGTVLRHSRRREVSQLSLVSHRWRGLIQERLYRHLKIEGTRRSINDAIEWFIQHPHLSSYVRHIDIWFPVFQRKYTYPDRAITPLSNHDRTFLTHSSHTAAESLTDLNMLPSENCTLEEVFRFIQTTFSQVFILTLEGGERKKTPIVSYFQKNQFQGVLPTLQTIRTLVCKGQWNLIRSNEDFQNLAIALPNLNEWHASYAKPKSKSYLSMATILPKLPQNLTNLNLCLEADYRREPFAPEHAKKVSRKTHFCVEMAKAMPTVEHLAYTGRICHDFFNKAAAISNPRESRLKTVDIVVKNVCRPTLPQLGWGDGSSITDMKFITAFEKLVVAATKSLGRLASVEFLRIRFIDLESQLPGLNPYFQLSNDQCTGIWSDSIVEALSKYRPTASFLEKPEIPDCVKENQALVPIPLSRARPLCITLSHYANLVSGITIS